MTHYYHATRNTQHYGASLTWRARGRQPQPRLPSPPALYRTDSKPPLVRSGRSQLRRLQSESHAINDQATRVEKPSAYPESRRKGTRWEGEGGGGGDPRASCVQRIPRCTNSRTMPPSICTIPMFPLEYSSLSQLYLQLTASSSSNAYQCSPWSTPRCHSYIYS